MFKRNDNKAKVNAFWFDVFWFCSNDFCNLFCRWKESSEDIESFVWSWYNLSQFYDAYEDHDNVYIVM